MRSNTPRRSGRQPQWEVWPVGVWGNANFFWKGVYRTLCSFSYESRKFRTKTEHCNDGRPQICHISVCTCTTAEAGHVVCHIIISAWALRCLSVFVGNARACNCRTSNGTDSHAFSFQVQSFIYCIAGSRIH